MRPKYILLVLALIALLALAFSVSNLLYQSPYARFGRQHGYSPPTFAILRTIQDRSAKRQPLTMAEIVALRRFADDSDWRIRCRALTALFNVGGTDQMPAADAIARSKLTDKEGIVRAYAISALARMKAPDAIQVARKMVSDSDENVRKRARLVLSRGW